MPVASLVIFIGYLDSVSSCFFYFYSYIDQYYIPITTQFTTQKSSYPFMLYRLRYWRQNFFLQTV